MEYIQVVLFTDWTFMDFAPNHNQITGMHNCGEVVVRAGLHRLEIIKNPLDSSKNIWVLPGTKLGMAESVFLNFKTGQLSETGEKINHEELGIIIIPVKDQS
ncbi:MAG: hypothetical protein WCG01_04180 [bacterium]